MNVMTQDNLLTHEWLEALASKDKVACAFRYLDWYRVICLPIPIPNSDQVWQTEIPDQASLVMHSALDVIEDYLRAKHGKQSRENKTENTTE